MKMNWVRLTMSVLMASMFVAGPVAAQALDVPVVSPLQSKPGSVRLMVSAGESGAPAGFTVERMTRVEFDAVGWDPGAASVVRGSFVGVPTFNIEGTADAYALAAGEAIEVELGQLFDETGVLATDTEELVPATEYVIRIRANGAAAGDPSEFSETMVVSSAPLAQNCTFTLGYWKNHPDQWPTTSLTLGTVAYSASELLAILNHPAGGNKLVILAHQLIAAKLNLLSGADPSAAAATIASADALIGGLICPPIGSDSLPSSPATSYANLLDDFNNGIIGPGHCGTTPAVARSWGSVKSMYRQ
jgi:hypothetical protein